MPNVLYEPFVTCVAYEEDTTTSREKYIANSNKNILSLVWRVDINTEGDFEPTWPVLITTRDILLTNDRPMEIGLQYSWKYWAAARALRKKQDC
jgi:hypothetical protein